MTVALGVHLLCFPSRNNCCTKLKLPKFLRRQKNILNCTNSKHLLDEWRSESYLAGLYLKQKIAYTCFARKEIKRLLYNHNCRSAQILPIFLYPVMFKIISELATELVHLFKAKWCLKVEFSLYFFLQITFSSTSGK